jgi:hypothetical protein
MARFVHTNGRARLPGQGQLQAKSSGGELRPHEVGKKAGAIWRPERQANMYLAADPFDFQGRRLCRQGIPRRHRPPPRGSYQLFKRRGKFLAPIDSAAFAVSAVKHLPPAVIISVAFSAAISLRSTTFPS